MGGCPCCKNVGPASHIADHALHPLRPLTAPYPPVWGAGAHSYPFPVVPAYWTEQLLASHVLLWVLLDMKVHSYARAAPCPKDCNPGVRGDALCGELHANTSGAWSRLHVTAAWSVSKCGSEHTDTSTGAFP